MSGSEPERQSPLPMERRRYGDAVARSLGLSRAPLLATHSLPRAQMVVTHHVLGVEHLGLTPTIPAEDTFVAALYLTDVPYHELWNGDRPRISQGYAKSSLRIVHLGDDCSARITHPHEALTFYIPRPLVNGMIEEAGGRPVSHLTCAPGLLDPTLGHLAGALLPALASPDLADPLFVDHVALAALSHLTGRYGGGAATSRSSTGGLSAPVLRTVLELLSAQAEGRPTLGDLASETGLSQGYLLRAFRKATGLTPHRWLQRHRVEIAKDLLRRTGTSIAEIAARCGFVDQSHLTRAFVAHVGMTPGEWRRSIRS